MTGEGEDFEASGGLVNLDLVGASAGDEAAIGGHVDGVDGMNAGGERAQFRGARVGRLRSIIDRSGVDPELQEAEFLGSEGFGVGLIRGGHDRFFAMGGAAEQEALVGLAGDDGLAVLATSPHGFDRFEVQAALFEARRVAAKAPGGEDVSDLGIKNRVRALGDRDRDGVGSGQDGEADDGDEHREGVPQGTLLADLHHEACQPARSRPRGTSERVVRGGEWACKDG